MLSVNDLSKSFGGVAAIKHVTLDFPTGTLNAIIGPNGAGKTTFFNLISGAVRPDDGRSCWTARISSGCLAPKLCIGASAGRFRSRTFFPRMTVAENLMAAVAAHIGHSAGVIRQPLPPPGVRAARLQRSWRCSACPTRPDPAAANLSHGDQKLLDIALALALEPSVLLLDEPTAGMGPEERWQMIEQGPWLWEQRSLTLCSSSTTWTSSSRSPVRSVCCATAACWPRARRMRSAATRGCDRGLSQAPDPGASGVSGYRPRVEAIDVFYGASQILFGVGSRVRRRPDHGAARRNGAGRARR